MNEKNMQHGVDWDWDRQNLPTGCVATEKYNGCRAYWDGGNLWSRGGIKIRLPDSWRTSLPAGVSLDGEIYDGVDGVYRCGVAIRYGRFTPSMRFMVFDCPTAAGDYQARLRFASKFSGGPINIVSCQQVSSLAEAMRYLTAVVKRGGEGLMLRSRDLKYFPGLTPDLLKFKLEFI
jgi:DNA ligase-1